MAAEKLTVAQQVKAKIVFKTLLLNLPASNADEVFVLLAGMSDEEFAALRHFAAVYGKAGIEAEGKDDEILDLLGKIQAIQDKRGG